MSKPGQELTLKYPDVLTEMETMKAAVAGMSISRFGDGELRLLDGGASISQIGGGGIRAEMKFVISGQHNTLVCIPHMKGPKYGKTWCKYEMDKYINHYTRKEYGSAFITRPDSAPWIDIPEYWELTRKLWAGKDITLVISEEHTSLRPGEMDDAKSIRLIEGPRRDAYQHLETLKAKIGTLNEGEVVILCLGAAATILAVHLNMAYHAHALDLGHIGRMMRKQGKWRDELSANLK